MAVPEAWKAEAAALQDRLWNSRNKQVLSFAKTIERMAKGSEESETVP